MKIRVMNKTRESVLGSRVQLADRWWERVRGFLGRSRPDGGEGILLSPCRAIHMIGMSFPLDVLFLDRDGAVVAMYPGLRPGKMTRFHRRASYALELQEGSIEASGTRMADRVVWMPTEFDNDVIGAVAHRNGAVSPAGGDAR
jgi:hypothetical protein